eukprot:g6906.t1
MNPLHETAEDTTIIEEDTTTKQSIAQEEGGVTLSKTLSLQVEKKTGKRSIYTIISADTSFCTHVGLQGVLVLLSMFIIAGWFGYMTYEYTSWFVKFNREFIWIFMLLGIFYFLALIWLIKTWHKIADDYTRRATGRERSKSGGNKLLKWYTSTFINGPYFLWKLYIIEFCESINQLVNFFTVYLCSLPMELTAGFAIALAVDSFFRGYGVLEKNTPVRRDRQIKLDIFVDFLCVALPIIISKFGYGIPISGGDMIQITFVPSVSILMKLRSIFREIIRVKSVQMVKKVQSFNAKKINRHRKSIFALDETIKMARKQQRIIPYKVRFGFVIYNVLYGMFLVAIVIFHLAVQNDVQCEPELLWKSCKVKVQFCGDMFKPTCDCVVLDVKKHNWTVLPKEINEMTGLKVMKVNDGPLEKLPDTFDVDFSKVVFLDLSYNALSNIPKSLGDMPLSTLNVANNNLNELPEPLWGNTYTIELGLDNNNISSISASVQKATTLNRLFMTNNSLIDLPDNIFDNLKLDSLFLDGNKLKSIPQSVFSITTLRNFRISNNYVSDIPKDIGNLLELDDIDLRNNSIVSLPENIEKLKTTLKYIYLHNNPICTNGWLDTKKNIKEIIGDSTDAGAGCKAQCSIYCQNRLLGNNYCAAECNVETCEFDKGDCSQ